MADPIDVQTIMREIRDRIRRGSAPRDQRQNGLTPASGPQLPEITALEDLCRVLHSRQALVGQLPPEPPTTRGRIGSLLVKAVRRTLFWYTPQLQNFHAGVVQGFEQLVAALNALAAANQQSWRLVENLSGQMAKMCAELERITRRVEAEAIAREGLQQGLQAETGAREELARRVEEHSQARQALEASYRQVDTGLHHLRAEVIGQATRISVLLEEARKKISKVSDDAQLCRFCEEDKHVLDAFYLSLEDRFRGTRDEIMERQRSYLPFLLDQKIGSKQMPILDIGCGRGEWLELLAESGLEARGVDLNRHFVAACKERGLNVIEGDAIECLRDLPTGSMGAVTGFHIIEHLPLEKLIRLIDETVRVLKPGGLAIFETPNPQNVLVSCHNFYIDPTHRNPLPGVTVQFMLEARGLCDVQILHLHPYPESFKVRDGGSEMMQRFNDYFYGPQDYAVIGRRI